MSLEPQCYTTTHPQEDHREKQAILVIREETELSHTAGRYVNWHSVYYKQSIPFLRIYPTENHGMVFWNKNIQSSTILNIQKLSTTQMPSNSNMDQ